MCCFRCGAPLPRERNVPQARAKRFSGVSEKYSPGQGKLKKVHDDDINAAEAYKRREQKDFFAALTEQKQGAEQEDKARNEESYIGNGSIISRAMDGSM